MKDKSHLLDTYTISKAYWWTDDLDITIKSDNLLYTEMNNLSGCQTSASENEELIRKKCSQIADLIREIDKLNRNY